MKKFVKIGAIAVVAGTTMANAALTVAPIDTTDFFTVAGAVIVATGIFFGVRKAMRLLG